MQNFLSDIVFDNTDCGLLVTDYTGTIIGINQWFLSHSRLHKADLISKSIFDCFAFSNTQPIERTLEHATKYGMSSFLSSALHPKLFPLYTRINRSSVYMAQSCYVKSITFKGERYALFQIQDVTDSTNREHLLHDRSKELSIFSLAVNHSPNAVVIIDSEGIVEYINPKYSEISNYESDDCIGHSYFSLGYCKENHKNLESDIWSALAQFNVWTGERCSLTKEGDIYWIKEHIYPIFDSENQISHYVAMQDDVTKFRSITQKIDYQASHDSLTGLINRQEFEAILRSVVNEKIQETDIHTLCFVDIDQFKIINETCGHIAGDELLRQISQRLNQQFNHGELVARLGGDEFAILLYGHNLSEGISVCEKLINLTECFKFRWNEDVFNISISIGIAEIDQSSNSYVEVLKQADIACYAAKNAGRNRYHVYKENDKALAQRKDDTYWATKINEAFEFNRFVLYAQPIVSLNKRHKISYEVLIRMKDEEGKIIPPGMFLPTAERFHLSHYIDQWVIDNTLAWMNHHVDDIEHIDHISINLSGLSLSNEILLEHIINAVKNSKVEASKISFEITETAAIANLTHAQFFISALNSCGCKFSLDDFGSGLSSFAYLKNLQVDILKIDGMFVKDMLDDPIDEAMVKSINDVGHVMGMETVAEFVENDDIRKKLEEMGIDHGQGYGLGKPAPINNILKESVMGV